MRSAFLTWSLAMLLVATGLGFMSIPWWTAVVPAIRYPALIVFGTAFVGFGACLIVPDRWPRLQCLAVMMVMSAFGAIMAAMVFAPLHPQPDGTYTIAGIPGLRTTTTLSFGALSSSWTGGAFPWLGRAVAGFFLLICVACVVLAAWGLVEKRSSRPDTYDDD